MRMKLKFPDFLLNTDVTIYKLLPIDKNGEQQKENVFVGKCIHHDYTRKVMTPERQLVEIQGSIVLKGAPYPFTLEDEYMVEIDGIIRQVFNVHRPKNPDGSPFSTELFLS